MEKTHSRLGIASVIIGLLLPVLLVSFIAIGIALNKNEISYASTVLTIFVFIAGTFPLIHLCGLIFGLIGWKSEKTKNLFPIIGTILNLILGLIGLFIIIFLLYQMLILGGLILH